MEKMMNLIVSEESGQGMVEYALILALISVIAIAVLSPIGTQIKDKLNEILVKLGGKKVT